ncbi:MAG: hypothetical protein IJT97_09545, partial [Bacteroidaceae bacterium]|nr:hypothetical protein [Bacteroidaceae bacterium]
SSAGTVTWSSSDERVATVVSGFVTAVADGTAIITAAVGGSTATCTVTVSGGSTIPEYEAVDLGLSVKWATMNVGASSPEEYGDYFAWGETEPKDNYDWSTYKWCNGSYNTQTKYCTKSSLGTVHDKTLLELEDDAAHAIWGGSWRMPTDEEWIELQTNCILEWTSQNGVWGCKVTAFNGNSIFLPGAGYRCDTGFKLVGGLGQYWSSSLYADYPIYVQHSGFDSYSGYYDEICNGNTYRYYGLSVRAVSDFVTR